MKNNVDPENIILHPHYNDAYKEYDLVLKDVADGLIAAGYNIKDNNNKNWWEDETLSEVINYRLEIHKDYGNFEKNTPITLSVKLYMNNTDITDTVPPTNFIWTRTSGNSEISNLEDKNWNNLHSSGSKSIVVTRDDVNRHAQFFVSFVKYEDDTAWVKSVYNSYVNSLNK